MNASSFYRQMKSSSFLMLYTSLVIYRFRPKSCGFQFFEFEIGLCQKVLAGNECKFIIFIYSIIITLQKALVSIFLQEARGHPHPPAA
jgi:hypothetical protein